MRDTTGMDRASLGRSLAVRMSSQRTRWAQKAVSSAASLRPQPGWGFRSSPGRLLATVMGLFWIWCALGMRVECRGNDLAKGLVVPIILPPGRHAIAVLRVGSLRIEYQRRGFFRLGVLPQAIAEDVTVEIRDPRRLAEILAAVEAKAFGLWAEGVVVLRNVCVRGDYQGRNVLVAATVRNLGTSNWTFVDGLYFKEGAPTVMFREAVMSVAGPGAGALEFRGEGPVTGAQLLSKAEGP